MNAIKDFLTKETAITDSFSVQTWMFIALAVAVVLLVLIVVSAIKNSKKSDNKSEGAVSESKEEIYIPADDEVSTEQSSPVDASEETVSEEAESENINAENASNEGKNIDFEEEPQPETVPETMPVAQESEDSALIAEKDATEEKEEVTQKTAEPVEKTQDAVAEEKTEPAAAEEKTEPAAAEEKTEPAAAEEKSEPAFVEERTVPAFVEERTVPAPVAAKKKKAASVEKAADKTEDKTETVPESASAEVAAEITEEEVSDTAKGKEENKENTPKKEKSEEEAMKLTKKKETKPEPKTKAKNAKPVKEEEKKVAVGKFEICNSVGGYRYMLLANNGQLLYESRDYKSADGCKEAVGKFVNAVEKGEFKVRADKFGLYKFNLKSPTSSNVIYVGESYTTKKACLSVVESVKRFAPVSPVVDITEADYVADAEIFDIPEDIRKAVESGTGAVGRWEIALSEPENEKSPYVYLLFANNGQLLYESREYKTEDSCRSGIDTFVKTLNEGVFIIDKDKFGRFKFILRSRRAGSQVEYVGQNYQDRPSCINSAISVFRFGLLTKAE